MERTKQYRCECLTTKGGQCRQSGRYRLNTGHLVCERHWQLLRQGHALAFRSGGEVK